MREGTTHSAQDASSRLPPDEPPSIADALRDSTRSIAEIAQYVGYFVSTKIDQFKLSIRTLVIYAVLGVMALVAAAAALVVLVVLLFVGLAHGLGSAMGGRDWLGDLIVSVVVLSAIALTFRVLLRKFKTAASRRTMGKYETRRKQQREQFGHDVAERSGE